MATRRVNAAARPQESEILSARTEQRAHPEGFVTVTQWKKLPREEELYCYAEAMQKMGLGEFWRHPQRWEAGEVQEVLQEICCEGSVVQQPKQRSQEKARWK